VLVELFDNTRGFAGISFRWMSVGFLGFLKMKLPQIAGLLKMDENGKSENNMDDNWG
jgi:hypothetical protein